ncbi:hypothetical protein GCM10011491_07690 [Brucella endophytica]|uniref:Uncharacterized protein n=1 Tax=Brucella endophytica TaxID=1963359 RepID=A0A916WB03_9HYPH|nr:hypothetical protein [Brucella endophytica]GGA82712.1 hypothetical protein GCM10011491_07690 [Brucella endophytica]
MNNQTVARTETLSYIHQLLEELHGMAHNANFPMLAYFIGMAVIESEEALWREQQESGGEERD